MACRVLSKGKMAASISKMPQLNEDGKSDL